MRERDALGRRGRAGRELHERDVVERRAPVRLDVGAVEAVGAEDQRQRPGTAARTSSNDGASARLVTTARAPEARRMAAVSSKYRGRSLVVDGG